jgi:hypothetical protein
MLKIFIWVTVIGSALYYLLVPLSWNPTITIKQPAKSFIIELPKDFDEISLEFQETTNIVQRYGIAPKHEEKPSGGMWSFPKNFASRYPKTLTIRNHLKENKSKYDDSEITKLEITIWLKNRSPVIINSVFVDGRPIDIKLFYSENLFSPAKTLNKVRYIRRDLSDFLLNFTDPISNLVLIIGVFYGLYLLGVLIQILFSYLFRYWDPQKFISNLQKEFNIVIKEDVTNAKISFLESHQKKERWNRQLQLLGPAIGFILTIASLIVGLNPSLKEVQNIEIFFETIQIAMVSTFVGLGIRIIAIFSQFLNNKLFIQADNALFTIEVRLDQTNNAQTK